MLLINSTFTAPDNTPLWGTYTGSLGDKYEKPVFQGYNDNSPLIIGGKAVTTNGDTFTWYFAQSANNLPASVLVEAVVTPDHPYGGLGLGAGAGATGGYFGRVSRSGPGGNYTPSILSVNGSGETNAVETGLGFALPDGVQLRLGFEQVTGWIRWYVQRMDNNQYLQNNGSFSATRNPVLWRSVTSPAGRLLMGFYGTNQPWGFVSVTADDLSPTGPTIGTQPTSRTVAAGQTATFTVAATASSGSLSYQWQRSTDGGTAWSNVVGGTGATTNSYTTVATTSSGGGANNGDRYRCAVTDSAGTTNSSSATLTVTAPDATAPTHTGTVNVTAVGSNSISVTWPTATDNVAVASYETSLDGVAWVTRGLSTSATFAGLVPSTSYTIQVRARDAAGNVSAPALQVTQATAVAEGQGTIAGEPIKTTLGQLVTTAIPKVAFLRLDDLTRVLLLTNQTPDGAGMLVVTNAALVAGVKYLRVLSDATGANVGVAAYTAS